MLVRHISCYYSGSNSLNILRSREVHKIYIHEQDVDMYIIFNLILFDYF
jgi:hypothetical protein